jgi:sugar lactone lactonase YvrE
VTAAEPDAALRVAVGTPALLGESPLWHPRERVLYYCDIPGRRLHRFDPAGAQLEQWAFDCEVSAIAPRLDGRLLLARRDGIWCFDPASGAGECLAEAPYDGATQRFNDGKCDALGRFWVGTMCEPVRPAKGTLQCFSDGALRSHFDGVSISNGLAWSPNARTMYWADTLANTVFAFDFDAERGTLSRRREWLVFAPPSSADFMGYPDGAAVDREGCYWVAMYGGQRVLRYSPDGELLRQVHLPVRCPTMPAFGGDDLRTLYITSARENRPAEELAAQPLAGCVFALAVDVPGLPVNFAS